MQKICEGLVNRVQWDSPLRPDAVVEYPAISDDGDSVQFGHVRKKVIGDQTRKIN